jgi:pimeloyl-ACP methyl ester carboxylesterase
VIETFDAVLPHGITLSCRASGPRGAPAIVFLHGFPEGAFVWDAMLRHFGDRYRCIAPNLRGYERSSAPAEVEAYRTKHLVADLLALITQQGNGPLAALVAHDWGGAVAWNFAVQHPHALQRLVIVNSPHPGVFLKALQTDPQQQAASAYMNVWSRPEAEAELEAGDFARLWAVFSHMSAEDPSRPGGWLTPAVKDQYRAVWRHGLTGALNYYRASPLRPPTGPDSAVLALQFPPEFVTVRVPTQVVWGEGDVALPASLLDGLDRYVPKLTLTRVPGATHWIVHELPALVAGEIEKALAR